MFLTEKKHTGDCLTAVTMQQENHNGIEESDKRSQWSGWWAVSSQDSGFSSSLEFKPQVKHLLSSGRASLHFRRHVVNSASFSENLT